jgi:hypothetical protein
VLRDLADSSDASIVDNIPTEVQKIVGCLVRQWWKIMTCLRPFADWREAVWRRYVMLTLRDICILFHDT